LLVNPGLKAGVAQPVTERRFNPGISLYTEALAKVQAVVARLLAKCFSNHGIHAVVGRYLDLLGFSPDPYPIFKAGAAQPVPDRFFNPGINAGVARPLSGVCLSIPA